MSSPNRIPGAGSRRVRKWLNAKTWYSWMDLALVVVMSFASLAAAWCGYQATVWNEHQSQLYARTSSTRVESVRATSTTNVQLAVEVLLFNNWSEAYVRGDSDLMTFYRNRMLPEVQAALDAWIAMEPLTNPDAPAEPFSIDGFQLPSQAVALALDQEAADLFEQGQQASHNASLYVMNTVLLAIVLFLAGLAAKFTWRPAQVFAAGLSAVLLLGILVRIGFNPIA